MVDKRTECYGSPPRNAIGKAPPFGALYTVDSSKAVGRAAGHSAPNAESLKARGALFDAAVWTTPSMSSAVSSSSQGSGQEDGEVCGELWMWGEGIGDGDRGTVVPGTRKPGTSSRVDSLLPRAVRSLVALDVQQIACGVRHAALVTKQGELFSWGEESGGRLGHSVDADVAHPQLVESLASSTVLSVSCGEYHSCAVTQAGDLYTWGDGTHNFGLLGHGNSISHWTPKRVSGPLEGVRVSSVACGPWHTVLVTSTGQLFTFGDGTFGVLGHGDRKSASMPREVESLKGLKTLRAACGPWHTAAVVEVMIGYSNAASSLSGKLFTWGDGDKNRLGHGDKEQKLVPTCVAALVDHNFRQVACGHSLTVALTTTGHLYTMGSAFYGQLGDPQATGRLPGLLRLGRTLVEEISCGAYHVAALTTRGEVCTWGRGANGRLGHGDAEDRTVPVLVEALRDKQVKKVACGSSFTSAVCLHKSVPGTANTVCSGCRQPFGFTRKKHNCYNCGLAYCHTCSSKKALHALLAPNPTKLHRVCDTCFVKMSRSGNSVPATRENSETKFQKIQTKGDLFKQADVKTTRRSKRPDSTSRVSPMPNGLLQWGGVNAPAAFNALLDAAKSIPQSRVGSRAVSPLSRRPSPPRSATPIPTVGGLTSPKHEVEEVKLRNESLLVEISRLKAQVEKLTRRCESHEKELLHSNKQIQDAFAVAGAESAKCKAAKEVIMSLTAQLKDLAERMPPGTYRSVHAHRPENTPHQPEEHRSHGNVVCDVPARLSDVDTSRLHDQADPRASNSATSEIGLEEWVEQDQPGVYITLTALPGGEKDLKRVRFSRKRFSEKQAEIWWQENRQRVYEQYNVRGRVSGSSRSNNKDATPS